MGEANFYYFTCLNEINSQDGSPRFHSGIHGEASNSRQSGEEETEGAKGKAGKAASSRAPSPFFLPRGNPDSHQPILTKRSRVFPLRADGQTEPSDRARSRRDGRYFLVRVRDRGRRPIRDAVQKGIRADGRTNGRISVGRHLRSARSRRDIAEERSREEKQTDGGKRGQSGGRRGHGFQEEQS